MTSVRFVSSLILEINACILPLIKDERVFSKNSATFSILNGVYWVER